jgi:hypothetical protein
VALHHEDVVRGPVAIERDRNGWPRAWWDLAGSAPEFDVGERDGPRERDNG